jgi:hypothetical protein
MDPWDHRLTSSHGSNGLAGAEYRAEIKELIQQGRMRDAMAKEIRDVRTAAQEGSGDATKYSQGIQQMLNYAKSNGWLNK